MTPGLALAEAKRYKRDLVDELNRVQTFERAAALALERDRQGQERLELVKRIGRARYAAAFLEMFGEPMDR